MSPSSSTNFHPEAYIAGVICWAAILGLVWLLARAGRVPLVIRILGAAYLIVSAGVGTPFLLLGADSSNGTGPSTVLHAISLFIDVVVTLPGTILGITFLLLLSIITGGPIMQGP